MPKPKRLAVQTARKKKFVGTETKWEKRRKSRAFARKSQKKRALAELLTIAPLAERKQALAKGKMAFYKGKKKIELPLTRKRKIESNALKRKITINENLCGIYKLPDRRVITFRASWGVITVHEVRPSGREIEIGANLLRSDDLGHIELRFKGLRGHGLALKGASKTEREQRATKGGKHIFESLPQFVNIFEKLGYEKGKKHEFRNGRIAWIRMKKNGKHQPLDDLNKFYRIEAIDPKTGKARMFTFPVKK